MSAYGDFSLQAEGWPGWESEIKLSPVGPKGTDERKLGRALLSRTASNVTFWITNSPTDLLSLKRMRVGIMGWGQEKRNLLARPR